MGSETREEQDVGDASKLEPTSYSYRRRGIDQRIAKVNRWTSPGVDNPGGARKNNAIVFLRSGDMNISKIPFIGPDKSKDLE